MSIKLKVKEIKKDLKNHIKLFKAIYGDKRTPRAAKFCLWGAMVYLTSPIDLIPDFIPIFGQLDDIIMIPGLLFLAIMLIPKEVYKEHHDRIMPHAKGKGPAGKGKALKTSRSTSRK